MGPRVSWRDVQMRVLNRFELSARQGHTWSIQVFHHYAPAEILSRFWIPPFPSYFLPGQISSLIVLRPIWTELGSSISSSIRKRYPTGWPGFSLFISCRVCNPLLLTQLSKEKRKRKWVPNIYIHPLTWNGNLSTPITWSFINSRPSTKRHMGAVETWNRKEEAVLWF